jgi:hypothetical protein
MCQSWRREDKFLYVLHQTIKFFHCSNNTFLKWNVSLHCSHLRQREFCSSCLIKREAVSASKRMTKGPSFAEFDRGSHAPFQALWGLESHSVYFQTSMAASRVVSTRRLCSRYKYFFYVAALILALQGFLGYSFYSMKEADQSADSATDTKAPKDRPFHQVDASVVSILYSMIVLFFHFQNNNNKYIGLYLSLTVFYGVCIWM